MSRSQPLLVLLDDPPQILTHLRQRLAHYLHLPTGTALDDDVELAVVRILVGEIIAKVPTSTLLSFESRARNDFRDCDQILEIERGVPSRIVLAVTRDGNSRRSLSQRLETIDRPPDLVLSP